MGIKRILLMLIVVGGIALENALAESGFEDFDDFEEFEDDGSADASKLDVIPFGRMIRRVTRRNPCDFNGYGCYCVLGGKDTPVDKLDRCCKVHKECYNKAQKSKACPFDRLGLSLQYSTKKGKPTKCEPAKHYCFYGNCRYRLCKCDAAAAKCFAKSPYQNEYKNYPQKKCTKGKDDQPESTENMPTSLQNLCETSEA